ncbi:hypothetical protein BYT27DRAFT_7342247 [Phlegmacium glaucopus]|nr:hypothetical protein BYT27DRAFT_7342247 [Phlegmacium glaucopus]
MSSKPNTNAIGNKEREIYEQMNLCSKDASISRDLPRLKEIAGVILAILDAAKAIKGNKAPFQIFAYDAGDLIVRIRQSYENAKDPQEWLSGSQSTLLQLHLGRLLRSLTSLLKYVEQQASATNTLIRIICNHRAESTDMKEIKESHKQLMMTHSSFKNHHEISIEYDLLRENLKKLSNLTQFVSKDGNYTTNLKAYKGACKKNEYAEKITRRTREDEDGSEEEDESEGGDESEEQDESEDEDESPAFKFTNTGGGTMNITNVGVRSTSVHFWQD